MKLLAILSLVFPLTLFAESQITGCTDKNNSEEVVGFNLTLGSPSRYYTVQGNSRSDTGLYRTDSDYGGIVVKKHSVDNGTRTSATLANDGRVQFYPRKRWMNDVHLAGVKVEGYAVQKLVTNSIVLDDLKVDDEGSAGKLGYDLYNGRYTCSAGACHFGPYAIQSSVAGSTTVINYNKSPYQHMALSLAFGDLALGGQIRFQDVKSTFMSRDGSTHENVSATRGCFTVSLKKTDGSEPTLAAVGQPETSDDRAVRHLIAWLELMAYDLFAE